MHHKGYSQQNNAVNSLLSCENNDFQHLKTKNLSKHLSLFSTTSIFATKYVGIGLMPPSQPPLIAEGCGWIHPHKTFYKHHI